MLGADRLQAGRDLRLARGSAAVEHRFGGGVERGADRRAGESGRDEVVAGDREPAMTDVTEPALRCLVVAAERSGDRDALG